MLDEAFAKRLIEELRSTQYEQIYGHLAADVDRDGKPDCFCVIGLACNILAQDSGDVFLWSPSLETKGYDMKFVDKLHSYACVASAPDVVVDRIGRDLTEHLISMNDRDKRKFPEIANELEAILSGSLDGWNSWGEREPVW